MPTPATARKKLDDTGIDGVCDSIGAQKSLTDIAREHDISPGSLLTWIEADPERSARVRSVRASMARFWDEKAENDLSTATDDFELKKAKELAHHYRWRSSKIGPREYGDKTTTELTGPDGGAIEFKNMDDDQLEAEIKRRIAASGLA